MSTNKKVIPIVSEDVDLSQLPVPLSRVSILKPKTPRETAEELAEALKVQHNEAA
jgi:hypothetical protein